MPRILIFAQRFPPSVGGTPTVLRNLCAALPPDKLAVVSLDDVGDGQLWDGGFPQARLRRPGRLWRRVDPTCFGLVPRVMRRAARLCPRHETEAVVGVFQNTCFLLAAWRLARRWGKPFFPYFVDTWVETRSPRIERAVACRLEPRIFRDAKGILLLSEPLLDYYRLKYPDLAGRMVCVPHAAARPADARDGGERRTDDSQRPTRNEARAHESTTNEERGTKNEERRVPPRWKRAGELLIVYTGQVYSPTADPIGNLIAALDALSDLNPRVVISSPDSPAQMARWGIVPSERVQTVRLNSPADVAELQRQADILFNPVSFLHRGHVQVRTLFPTKTIEYLAADRPMLVHGPGEAAFVRYAQVGGFAEVATDDSSAALAASLRAVAAEPADARRTARAEALRRHDPETVAPQFLRTVFGDLPK